MKLLTFSTLYPSAVMPSHGIFVETRLRHLVASGQVQSRVVAPVPWFPFKGDRFGEYGKFAATPAREHRHGLEITHPRFLRLPKVGMSSAPYTLAWTFLREARRLQREGGDFDLIDAHYFYPDGVAAVMVARALNKPVVITARGTDINLIPQYDFPRKLILQAAQRANAQITVCAALKDELVALGADASKVQVLRNGVDLTLFHPGGREEARQSLGLAAGRFTLASVGHLIERKGHELVIGALAELPEVDLLIAGAGPEEGALRRLAATLGVQARVRFLGAVPQARLREVYVGCDALVLASSREGWANVLLEAMACGTPVAASNVWGTPEVVATHDAGELMPARTATGVAEAVRRLRAAPRDRAATRRYAEQFSWDATTQGQLDLFHRVLAARGKPELRHA
ncbi:glycosyltransferase family 4 protein [Roseateles amylovorans]|uniref:Glycosyltransferase family 4 protein n=1 Tax=Roseateles amylovorans TaxID=2978473 RepID=A0ABY6B6N6_9BURK|nr:glycosyltransferase family 4 protein [Roseateles amylovorans]UXH80926.1 glycosyltransferase family 4 protein [Roseateles amylovorans]